jgi:hypothetical protein
VISLALIFAALIGFAAGYWTKMKVHEMWIVDKLATGDTSGSTCTRGANHEGPCNGFPTPACPAWRQEIDWRQEIGIAPVTLQPVFQTQSGQSIESPRPWDKNLQKFGGPQSIPYEELEGMFLDQFLIRFFHSLMPQSPRWLDCIAKGRSPWEHFSEMNAWAKEMPLLFEQMTGYALNEIQLNNAIAEYARRLSKSSRADTPGPHETMESPHQSYTGI